MIVKQFVRKRAPFILGFAAGLMLLAGFLWFGHPTTVQANTTDLSNFEGQYPAAVGSAIDTCTLCHTSAIPVLNPYGSAYLSNGRSSAALVAIESLDSDGDGFTNIQEITVLTFPGDPNSQPGSGASPTPTLPGPTATMVPTTATMVPPTVTMVPSETTTPPTQTMVPSPTQHGYPPPEETETEEPHVTRTPHPTHTPGPTRTPRPTGQPTICPPGRGGDDNGGFMSTPGSPDDRDEMHGRPPFDCMPVGGGDDGGGHRGGGGGGGDAVVAPSGVIAFLDSLLGIH